MSDVIGSVDRGCGRRVQGGIYAECGTSRNGKPVEAFLLCPPIVVDNKALGLTPVGVKVIEDKIGDLVVHNVWDWIGSVYYPNVADFVEEVRRFGMSRRLPRTLDYGKLNSDSRMYLLHSRAYINEPIPYHTERIGGRALGYDWAWCPLGRHDQHDQSTCAGLWWEDLRGEKKKDGRIVERFRPSFAYTGALPPHRATPNCTLAVFAAFPIYRLAIVRADDDSHERSAEAASAASIPFEIVEE